MTRITLTVLLALVICPTAGAGFQVGIAEPGPNAISRQDIGTLGLSAERRTLTWHGQSVFTGKLNWTPGLRHFLTVSAGYPAVSVPTTADARVRFCGFVASALENVSDVIIWNEPNLAMFWNGGAASYALLVRDCSPRIRAAGTRVWAPGMSPASIAGAVDFARKIAALGPHLIDGWDQHEYDSYTPLARKIAVIRAAFGWKIPVLIGESGTAFGSTIPRLMSEAYCAGAMGWLNFKLRDDGDWRSTGIENADGSRKPSYAAFASMASRIRAGRYDCSTAPTTPPPPKPPRTATRSRYGKSWICPERPDGTIVWKRGLCELDRVRIR